MLAVIDITLPYTVTAHYDKLVFRMPSNNNDIRMTSDHLLMVCQPWCAFIFEIS
jgi:hypothetical protein